MKSYIKTSIWYKQEITNPCKFFLDYFPYATVVDYRRQLSHIMKRAYSKGVWQKHCPANALFSFGQLEGVINAAYLINKEGNISQKEIKPDDVFNPNLFRGWIDRVSDWDYLLRSLSFEEYANPYLVFKRFFKYRALADWKKELKLLLEYVLSPNPVFENIESSGALQTYVHLLKLTEAAHLIDVRGIIRPDGRIKSPPLQKT